MSSTTFAPISKPYFLVLIGANVVEDIRADQNKEVGLAVFGDGVVVRNNQVVATGGTTNGGGNANAFGIAVGGSGVRVLNNDVIGVVKQGTGVASGIRFSGGSGSLAVNNRITQAGLGIEYAGSTGKFRDNITFDVTTPYTGGTNIGNNN